MKLVRSATQAEQSWNTTSAGANHIASITGSAQAAANSIAS